MSILNEETERKAPFLARWADLIFKGREPKEALPPFAYLSAGVHALASAHAHTKMSPLLLGLELIALSGPDRAAMMLKQLSSVARIFQQIPADDRMEVVKELAEMWNEADAAENHSPGCDNPNCPFCKGR